MTQQPPPSGPPVPNLAGYRPFEERAPTPAPPIEERFRPPGHAPRPGGLRAPTPKPKRGRSVWRILAWGLGGLGVLLVASIGLLVVFAPVGLIRDQVVREVKARTGRDLVIAGGTSLSVFPTLAVSMGDVSLSPPRGMGREPFVRMRRLEVNVPLLPLLARKVTVERLVLTEPVFDLWVDGQGRRSWDFAALAIQPTIQLAQATPRQGGGQQTVPPELQEFLRNSTQGEAAANGPARRGLPLQDIALGDIRIDNGTIRYRDERNGGASEEIRAINARLSGKSLAAPIEAKGDLALRGDTVAFEARLASPKALLEERPARVMLALSSPRGSSRYDGSLSLAKGPQLDGTLKLDTRSLRGLASWIGASLPDNGGLGAFALEGELRSGPTWIALANAKGRLDDIAATGSINADLVNGRPSLKANLKLGAVDLNTYLETSGAGATTAPGQTPAARQPAPAPGPQVKGFTKRSGWSEAAIDVTALGLVDADARLAIAGITYRDIKVGNTQLAIGLKGRTLTTTIEDIKLYGGQGRGVITVDGNAPRSPSLGANLALDGVAALALLKDVVDFDWLDGKARVQLAIGGQGANEKAIMESLNGRAEFSFNDGAIVGYNIPQMIRGISQGKLAGISRQPTERTDFSEAAASFQIKGGVAETKDLRAASPLMRLAGTGTINLGQRQIDATLRPKLVGSLSGQGGGGELAGLELPVRIRGSWERPQIAPDIDGLLKNPNQAVDALKELGRQIQQKSKGGGLDKLIDQLFR